MNALSGVVIDSGRGDVWVAGKTVTLSNALFQIFKLLWSAKGRVVPHWRIYSDAYGLRPECDLPKHDTLKTQICKINRLLRPLGLRILNEWGEGYRLVRVPLPQTSAPRIAA